MKNRFIKQELQELFDRYDSIAEIARVTGYKYDVINYEARKLNIKKPGRWKRNYNSLIGTKSGYLDIKSFDGTNYICYCNFCNSDAVVPGRYFFREDGFKSYSCTKCRPVRNGRQNKKWLGGKYISKCKFNSFISGANKRKLEFNISIKDIEDIYIQNNFLCPITNEYITFSNSAKERCRKIGNASLDRIDNSKGYIANNILVVHKHINNFHLSNTIDEMINYAKLILYPTISNKNYISDIASVKINKIKYVNNARKIPFEFTINKLDLIDLYNKQDGLCYYTGLELICYNKEIENNWSLDRIDSSKGYIKDNVVWTTKTINQMKNVMSEDRFRLIAKCIANKSTFLISLKQNFDNP